MLKTSCFLLLLSAMLVVATGCQRAEPVIREITPTIEPAPAATTAGISVTAEIAPRPTTSPSPAATTTVQAAATEENAVQPDVETPTPAATATETPVPTDPIASISLAPVVEGALIQPLYLTHAGDERLFVIEQAGVVRIIEQGQLRETPFLDIRDRVGSSQYEQGLLGIAFHPNYTENGAFFVNYTNLGGNTHISRFMIDPDDMNRADPSSETLLLRYEQPYPNHNGGQIAFGPDGYLYIGVGDGGSANDPLNSGQNPATILGTLLRLDVDQFNESYRVPASNPFVGDESRLNEIWSWGLRNPWRFSFDRVTGDLFIADVGQNLWEEVNFQPAASNGGENYGWNIMEASHCFAGDPCDRTGLELPVFEYSHEQGCSITGGYMYRGSQFPELYGNYLVADYCQGTIWRLFPENSGDWSSAMVHDSPYTISSFGEDAAGELYIVDHVGGSVYQITP